MEAAAILTRRAARAAAKRAFLNLGESLERTLRGPRDPTFTKGLLESRRLSKPSWWDGQWHCQNYHGKREYREVIGKRGPRGPDSVVGVVVRDVDSRVEKRVCKPKPEPRTYSVSRTRNRGTRGFQG